MDMDKLLDDAYKDVTENIDGIEFLRGSHMAIIRIVHTIVWRYASAILTAIEAAKKEGELPY